MLKTTTKRQKTPRAALSQLTGVERTFGQNEIIVTKTNLKGHITYANQLFCRLAGYTQEEVIGAPHCLIRHPDMPHGVFKLLWETIEAGQEIFAYVVVVNRSANGDHYWVLAHVTPSFGPDGKINGYHSNRRVADRTVLKNTIIPLYAQVREAEAAYDNPKQKAEAGLKFLADLLNQKGIRYDAFIFSLIDAV